MGDRYMIEKALLESKYNKKKRSSQIGVRLPEGLKEEYRSVFGNKRIGERIVEMLIDELAKHYSLTK